MKDLLSILIFLAVTLMVLSRPVAQCSGDSLSHVIQSEVRSIAHIHLQ